VTIHTNLTIFSFLTHFDTKNKIFGVVDETEVVNSSQLKLKHLIEKVIFRLIDNNQLDSDHIYG